MSATFNLTDVLKRARADLAAGTCCDGTEGVLERLHRASQELFKERGVCPPDPERYIAHQCAYKLLNDRSQGYPTEGLRILDSYRLGEIVRIFDETITRLESETDL